MRLSTVFISSTFVLAGMSAAFPVETEDMLVARFADSDFLSEVEARAYDEEPELYVHGGYKTLSRHRRSFDEPSPDIFTRRGLPDDTENNRRRVTFAPGTKDPSSRSPSLKSIEPPESTESPPSGFRASVSKVLDRRPRIPGPDFFKSKKFRDRRSFDDQPHSELARRHEWNPHTSSRTSRVSWSLDTVDTPNRTHRPLTPSPIRNGNWSDSGSHHRYHHRSFFELARRHEWDPHRPETPPRTPRGVSWSSDTVDTPDRPRRPPTPSPHSPIGNGNGNGHGNGIGNGHSYHHYHRRSFFDLD